MNTMEPDWAHVARSVAKVLVVTVALFLAFSVVDRVLWVFIDSGDRMARLYGTAALVANPDKRLYGYRDDEGLLESTYTLRGEPRRAGPSEGSTDYDIVENVFGAVRAASLDGPSGNLADAIDSMDASPGDITVEASRMGSSLTAGNSPTCASFSTTRR